MSGEEDPRKFIVSHKGDYFAGWEGTKWETVKRCATWTKEKSKAKSFRLPEAGSFGLIDLVCGFSGTELEQIR